MIFESVKSCLKITGKWLNNRELQRKRWRLWKQKHRNCCNARVCVRARGCILESFTFPSFFFWQWCFLPSFGEERKLRYTLKNKGDTFEKVQRFWKNLPRFFKNAREDLENLRRFFELSPSEDFEEGMFSKKDEYYLEGKPYFCSSRGCANGDFGSVLTRKSWVSALVVPHIFPKRFSYSSSCPNSSFKA